MSVEMVQQIWAAAPAITLVFGTIGLLGGYFTWRIVKDYES